VGVRLLRRWRAALRRRSAWWLYGDARYSRHERRRIRRRWLEAALLLAVALGVIVFAVFAFGRDPMPTGEFAAAMRTGRTHAG
jgi:hypothetical protein